MTAPLDIAALRGCPFCGGEAVKCFNTVVKHPAEMHWVLCRDCHAGPGDRDTEAEAIAAWNTRAPDAALLARVAELEAMLSDAGADWRTFKGSFLEVQRAWPNGGIEAMQRLNKLPGACAALSGGGELRETSTDAELVKYVQRYGGRCRECADNDGMCPMSGLPCRESEKAIRHVLEALHYGTSNGYISLAQSTPAVGEGWREGVEAAKPNSGDGDRNDQ